VARPFFYYQPFLMSPDRSTLLLADDDPTIADSLAPFLERAGFHVLVVSDGVNALEKAQSHHPELIILDVLMPRMDGRETLRRLRKAKIWTPTILLTQVGEASERALALEEGADDYLNKPFDLISYGNTKKSLESVKNFLEDELFKIINY